MSKEKDIVSLQELLIFQPFHLVALFFSGSIKNSPKEEENDLLILER